MPDSLWLCTNCIIINNDGAYNARIIQIVEITRHIAILQGQKF